MTERTPTEDSAWSSTPQAQPSGSVTREELLVEVAALKAERNKYLARVSPISPQGDDYVDELESAIGFLRHDVEVLKAERARLEQELQEKDQALSRYRAGEGAPERFHPRGNLERGRS